MSSREIILVAILCSVIGVTLLVFIVLWVEEKAKNPQTFFNNLVAALVPGVIVGIILGLIIGAAIQR